MPVIQSLPPSAFIHKAVDGQNGGDTSVFGARGSSFGEVVSDFLKHANQAQQKGDEMVEALALGEPVDIHQVMLALNEASNALHLTLQVRSKILEAYQDIMHTQI
jgi:flagellar hook-basal body complex protein FliE